MSADNHTPLPPEAYGGPHRWQTHGWARFVRRMLRHREYLGSVERYCAPLRVFGVDQLDALTGPAIFVPNHQSHMDAPVIVAGLPTGLRDNFYFGAAADRWFVKGKKKLVLQPWYQSLALGTFPIVRGGGSKTLDYARELLRHGANICIFPEGTRATSDELGRFRHGVSILAIEEQVPLVPVVLKGLRELRPKGAREVRPGPASITFLPPITLPRGIAIPDATDLLWATMNREFRKPIAFPVRSATPEPVDRAA